LRDGRDPSAAKQAERQARADRAAGSFEVVAREWHALKCKEWKASHSDKVIRRLEMYAFPKLGKKPLGDITPPDILTALQAVVDQGNPETAHRLKEYLGGIFRYAVATHRVQYDPSATLKGALPARTHKSFASVTDPKKVGALLRTIEGYWGTLPVRYALRLAPLFFMRPGELRAARWEEFSFDLTDPAPGKKTATPEPQWRVPAERMKMGEQHIVPLSTQAVTLLRELYEITGPDGFLFPNRRTPKRCMSENTLKAALRYLGIGKDEMTGHGFRHMASTLLHERGYKTEMIERQLAHGDRDTSRASYNFAQYLPERRRMMQEWADYLDGLASGATVVNIKSGRKKAKN
jgi:integrase